MHMSTIRIAAVSLILSLWGAVAYAGTHHYYYTDPQGTVLARADASGAIIATYDYAPYGTAVASMSPAPNGPGYTGHVNDPDTGLVYMQARYYDPGRGGFLSVDPVTPSPGNLFNFNRYDYANDNPYRFTDPDGRSTCANSKCTMSTIDSNPGVPKGYSPSVNGNQGLPAGNVGHNMASANSPGPTITFTNDNPHGASPNQPVTTATAKMVESGVMNSGVQSVNVNSTTGGQHAATSNHYLGKAVDINRVDSQRVDNPANRSAVAAVQNAFRNEPNIRENFGPTFQEKTLAPGATPVPWTQVGEDHQNHIHESGQQ
jgi:RHS repeat-associated protein